MKLKPNHQRSPLSSAIRWVGDLRRQTTSLHDLASSAALLTSGSLLLENFDSIVVNNKLALGQELLAAEAKQLETLRNLGFLQESPPPQQTTRDDPTTPVSLQDLTLDALARHALELQQELVSFLLQILRQESLHQRRGDLSLQGDLLQLNRKIRALAVHCDMVSGMDRPAHPYNSGPIAANPVILHQMTEIASTLVRCVRQGYEPRVWKAFFSTPALHFSVLRDDEEKSGKAEIEKLKREIDQLKKEAEIEKLKREVDQLKKGMKNSQQKTDATEELSKAFKDTGKRCFTAEELAPFAKIQPQSINARVKALADLNWLHQSVKGKKRCFTLAEGLVLIENPCYKNLGAVII